MHDAPIEAAWDGSIGQMEMDAGPWGFFFIFTGEKSMPRID